MKTLIFLLLIGISLIASEQKEVPSYIIDAKNYNLIDSKKAFFIINSRKYGTMQDHFAFAKEEDAKEHVEKYGGSVVDYETYIKSQDNNGTK
ncbi:MAG: hypothetical protein QG559_1405 [Campylobacterota bacterium]|nr:hypothetical protein [Campylobacterota bacterium]